MPIDLGYGSRGAGDAGLGEQYDKSKITGPWGTCPYHAEPNGGPSIKGGDPTGRWAEHKETPNLLMGVARDGLSASPTATGDIVTPMSTAKSEMPGLSGSSGTGPTGEGKISTPWGHGTAGWEGSSTGGTGGSSPTNTPGTGSTQGAGAKSTY